MNFIFDDEDELFISPVQITAVKFKRNKNDGSFKNREEYPFVADVHVVGREKPFTVFLTREKKQELVQFLKDREDGK